MRASLAEGLGAQSAAIDERFDGLCIPHAADQFRNADACASAGAGIGLEGGSRDGVSDR
jgi:hypothetical protein